MKSRAAAAVAVAAALLAGGARAHVVYGTETLRGLVQQSDLVARVRILSTGTGLPLEEPVVSAQILETLKGPAASPEPLRFVQHGHGVPLYQNGQEVALFLQRIERSRELGSLAVSVGWVSIQEGDALAGDAGLAAALRAYAALEKLPSAERLDGMRAITLKLLASPDPRLSSSAVQDLALADEAFPIVAAQDLPALEKILWNGMTPIGVRVALLSELERRGLVPGSPQWVRLLRETRGEDQIAVVRAAAAHPSAPVTQELVGLLGGDDALLVSAAAISLGAPGNEKAVAPLGKLLGSSQERVRMSAIRGLGRIGTPSAQASLEKAAASHPDPDTRRRARAEVAARP